MSKLIRVSLWNPITKKVICKSRTVREGEDIDKCKEELIKWRDDMKLELKKDKARLLLKDSDDDDYTEEEEENKYDVHDLDLNIDRDTGSVICIFGSSKSGKTYLTRELVKKYYNGQDGADYVITLYANNKQQPIYDGFPREVNQTFEFLPDLPRVQKKINKKLNNRYKFLNILDDCLDNNTKNSEILKKLMLSYRNSNLSTILNFQDPVLLKKSNRSNAHYIFCLHLSTDEAIEGLIKKYLSSFLGGRGVKMDDKIKLYKQLTSNHNFILIETGDDNIRVCRL
jgi:hypothetical protein